MVAQGRPGEVFNHLAADWQIPAPTIQQLAQKWIGTWLMDGIR